MDTVLIVGWLLSLFATVNAILLLTNTIGIVNNGNILTDGRDERKYLEKKYNNAYNYYM